METVYLGLFSSLFKKIFNAILKPVIEFIGGLINKVFTWIFDNILKPLLVDVLLPLFKWLIELIYEILAGVIYGIFAELLKIIDTIQKIFDVFAGIKPVTYDGKSYYMLDLFFSRDFVQKAVWILIAISFALMMAFAIIAVMRSMADLSGEMKNPVSKVLRLTFQCLLKLVMIPFVCILLIRLSGTILVSVNNGIKQVAVSDEGASETTMGRMIFCMASLDAAKDETKNVSKSDTAGLQDELRKYYYFSDITGTKKYSELGQVSSDFKFEKFNYVTGFGVGLIFLMIMGVCIFKFINRIFNVILLYITAPLFVCSMPLDEGKNYNQWKEMFVGQLFSGYGAVISMQIYLMVAPMMLSGKLKLMNTTPEGDIVIRMVFIIGGALAIESAGTMLTGLISSTASSMESAQAQQGKGLMASGYALAKNVAGAAKRTLLPKGGGGKEDGKEGGGAGMPELPEEGKDGGKGDGGKEGSSGGSNKFDGSKGSGEKGTGAKFEGKKQGGAGSNTQTKSAKSLAEKSGLGKSSAAAEKSDQKDEAGKDTAGNKSEAGGKAPAGNKGVEAAAAMKTGAGKPGAKADPGEAGNKDAAAGKNGAAAAKKGGAGKPGMPAKPDTARKADAEEEEEEQEEQEDQQAAVAGGKKGGASGAKKGGAAAAADAGKKDGKKDKKEKFNKAGVRVTSSFLGGMFVKGVDKDGKSRWGLNLGSKFNFGLKKDGSVGCNVFGIASWKTDAEGNKTRSILGGAAKWGQDAEGNKSRSLLGGAAKWGENADGTKTRSLLGTASWKVDKDGNTTKVSIPFMRFKSVDDGKGGKTFKLSKVQLTKGMKFKRAMYYDKETGALKTEMYCADFSPLGVKKAFDQETGKVETIRSLTGDNFARTRNKETGKIEYIKTHSDFLGRTKIYDRDKAGNYHVVATRGWVSSEIYSLDKETGETTLLKSQLNNGGFSLYDNFDAQEKSEEAAKNGPDVPKLDAGPVGMQESDKKNGKESDQKEGGNAANIGAKKEPAKKETNAAGAKQSGKQGKAAQFSVSAGPSFSADKDGVKLEAHTINMQPAIDNMEDIGESLNKLFNEETAGTGSEQTGTEAAGAGAQFTMQSGPSLSVNKDGVKPEAHPAPKADATQAGPAKGKAQQPGDAKAEMPKPGAEPLEAPQNGMQQQNVVQMDVPQVEMPQADIGGIESLNVDVPQVEAPQLNAAQPGSEIPKAEPGAQFTMQSGPTFSGNKDGIKAEAHAAPKAGTASVNASQPGAVKAEAPKTGAATAEAPQAGMQSGTVPMEAPQNVVQVDVPQVEMPQADIGGIESLNVDVPQVEAPQLDAAQPGSEIPKAEPGAQFTMQSGPTFSGNKDGIKAEAHAAPKAGTASVNASQPGAVKAEAPKTGAAKAEAPQAGMQSGMVQVEAPQSVVQVDVPQVEMPQADIGGADILMDDVLNTSFSLGDEGVDNSIHEQAIESLNAQEPALEPVEKIIEDEVKGATEIHIVQKQLDGAPGSDSKGSSTGAGFGGTGNAYGGGFSGSKGSGSGSSSSSTGSAAQAPAQDRPVVEKHVEKEVEGTKIEIEQLVFADAPQGGDEGDGAVDYGYPQEDIADGFEMMEHEDFVQPEDFSQPDIPQVEAPQVEIPQANIPQPEILKADAGRPEMPKPEMPNLNMAKPEMPKTNTTSKSGSTGSNTGTTGNKGGGNKGGGNTGNKGGGRRGSKKK